MNAGDLNRRITIQYDDTDGTITPQWKTLITVWANKRGLRGRTFYQAAATHSESDIIYTIRYRIGIKSGMHIIDGTNEYEIKAPPVDVDGKKTWLELYAKDVTVNGG